jgi:hypothetical protein
MTHSKKKLSTTTLGKMTTLRIMGPFIKTVSITVKNNVLPESLNSAIMLSVLILGVLILNIQKVYRIGVCLVDITKAPRHSAYDTQNNGLNCDNQYERHLA